jgi:dihydrofolate reductase
VAPGTLRPLDHGLVDELRLMVFPTVVGSGLRLLPEGEGSHAPRPSEVRPAGETLITIYAPARA